MSTRSIGLICAALMLTACGGSQRQDAHEPTGNFKVQITGASFPASQRLAEHTHLVLAVHNLSGKTLPDLAVTICNVTCAFPAPPGQGTSAAAFSEHLQMPGLARPSRPVWVLDNPPRGAVTAYSNTWALGQLPAGDTAKFNFGVTAVKPGRHVVAWVLAAGLNGKARAVLPDGSLPHGTFAVTIQRAPARQLVTAATNP